MSQLPQSAESLPREASFEPYAQLVKMLMPSSGSVAIYDPDGDLIWCSDGFERPDMRELVEDIMSEAQSSGDRCASVRTTTEGVAAFAAALTDKDGHTLGFAVIELKQGPRSGQSCVTPSLLRPVLECIESRMTLERDAKENQLPPSEDLEMLLALDDDVSDGPTALQRVVQHCVDNLDCVGGAFIVPEKNFTIVVGCAAGGNETQPHFLDRTQKHLLAWAQLNNRPMIVNRVGANEQQAPYKILSCPIRDPENRVTGLMALFRGATAANFEIRDVRILEFMSRKAVGIMSSQHDPLTGLVNRRIFERRAQKWLDAQGTGATAAVLYLDIDRLQLINEAFGYQAGDEVIERLAEVMRSLLEGEELATRAGGDRFAALLPDATVERAESLAQTLLTAMSSLGYINGGEAVPVSVSVGLATSARGATDIGHLLAAAEFACKRAKQQGRNRLERSTESSLLTLARRDELFASASLRQALQNNEFRLEAQPVVEFRPEQGRILGYEILVRMRDSSGQLVAPDKFAHAAERYGLMPALDKWVVSATIRALKDSAQLLASLPLGISINLAGQTLQSESFPELTIAELRESGLDPAAFCFEISESAAINHVDQAGHFIDTFARAGCHVALDDFGHGLTSLAHLKRLKVRYLKIDGSLTRRVLDDLHVESMVRGLAKAAQTLGVTTVAEHVESQAVADKLVALEIDLGQGFFFSHPQPLMRVLGAAARVPLAAARPR